MSSRQKSLFDQDHGSKAKPRWQGDRSFDKKSMSGEPVARPEPPKSPVRASTQSKSKLKAFQFVEGRPGSQSRDLDKENRTGDASKKSPSPAKDDKEMEPAKTPSMAHSKIFPSTPAMRLPLADLIGNAEEALRRPTPKEEQPEEHIGWIPNSSHPDLSPQRRRKRAHSSSPITASQKEASERLAVLDPLDLQNLNHSLKTPHADPAADLWTRYATGRNADETPLNVALPSFAHLINDSSPRSAPRTPAGSVGGLRRWQSCGIEWPASKAKRRRTNGVFRDRQNNASGSGEDGSQSSGEPKTKQLSRVGMLVEQVQESLAKPSLDIRRDAPSSSSPLPDKGDVDHLQTRADHSRESLPQYGSQSENNSQHSNHRNTGQRSHEISEFGDDDLDFDMMEDMEPVESKPTAAKAQFNRRSPSPTKADRPQQGSDQHNTTMLDTIDEDSDEFGDDIDITADDIDNAVPIYNTQSAASSKPAAKRDSANFASHDETKAASNAFDRPQQSAVAKHTISPSQQVHDLTGFSDDDDEFGGSDLDDEQFAKAEFAATQAFQASAANSSSRTHKSRTIQRYLVKQVIDGQYADEKGRLQSEKVFLVEDESAKRSKAITLRQTWIDTHCTAGSYVHVVGNFDKGGQIIINDAKNMIIVHPDHLISATVVADSFECIRRAVLQDRVKATSRKNEPNVYGSILHEVFQEALKANSWDAESLNTIVEKTLLKFLESLFEIGHEDTNKAMEHLKSKLPELQSWATAFVKARPGPDAQADDRNGKKILMSITKLLDVEEHVWSPTYGLKGNIDATVQTVMQDEEGERSLTVPLEVKTGRNTSNSSHRAQTALYTLLLSDRYDIEIIYGVLYYMETSAIARVPAIRNELRHMVMQRNELACYVRERLQLPPMLQNPHKCGRCYAKTQCFLYHKLAEDGTNESAGVKEKFEELVGKLQPAHQEFFKKWDDLLTKEESEMMKFRRELWTMLSKEREKLGRCFSEVVIEAGSRRENDDAAKINRFSYTFLKKEISPGFSFTESQITVGEPIVISSEQGHFALANGYVTKVSTRRISVAVDRRLHNARKKQHGFNSQTNQTFAGIMEVGKEDQSSPAYDGLEDDMLYRLDKDEFSNGMATVRNNLLAIMDDSVYRSAELRSLIVEDTVPKFKPTPTAYTLTGPASQLQINSDQRAAIDKVMSARDYALVLGMPGTGKTTTIAHIIRALVARGKSVLLTSYTHTAVDNILLKLSQSDISILRLGSIAKIHPEVQAFANLGATPKSSLEEINECYMTPQVVATTCLGVNHQLFHRRVFDYCIVDEASQITLPVCLGPIRMARTFVLVGDHYQLPPLVQNRDAAEGGLDVSLFKLLSDRRPESVVNLEHQYRMCEEIMLLSNTLIYSGRLKCGTPAVAQRMLSLPTPDGLSLYHTPTSSVPQADACLGPSLSSRPCWLEQAISPSRKSLFLNTDTLAPAPQESAHGSRITNATEAILLTQTVLSFLASGVPASEIGVITFYRSQLALLRQTLRRHPEAAGVEMHTADKFQGRDKEVVLVSCVRSNESGNVGDLLKDWRRINVAFTRARSKLLVFGSRRTLACNELLDTFLKLMDRRAWVLDFPAAAEREHDFEDGIGASVNTQRTPGKSPQVVRKVQGRKPLRQGRVNGGAGLANKRSSFSSSPPLMGLGITKKKGTAMKPFKVPEKVGVVGQRALARKGSVFMDIVNEVLGDENVEA